MVDPVTMFMEGGPFVYLLALFIPAHLVLTVVQIVLVKRADLLPLLWASVLATVMVGMLGSVMGVMLAFQAVANAPEDVRMQMMAQGFAVSLHTTSMGLMVGLVNAGFTGVTASVVRTLQYGQLRRAGTTEAA